MSDLDEPEKPRRPVIKPSVWSPRPIPQAAPERRTADVKTPKLRELAARDQPGASMVAPVASSSQTPVESGVKPSVDCAAAWAKYDGEADAVLARGRDPRTGRVDPFERNRAITAGYARVFLSDPGRRFRWLGAGAFASEQVGCGIFDSQEMERNTYGVDPRHGMAERAERKLGEGNAAVFRNIVPPHRMFQEHGIDGIRRCGSARPGRGMNPAMTQAFELMNVGDEASLRASAAQMVTYEQRRMLQPIAFDDSGLATMLRRNQTAQRAADELPGVLGQAGRDIVSGAGSRPMKVAFGADCSGPYELEFAGDDPANPEQRVPYAQQVVRSFSDQIAAGGAARAATEAALHQLANFHPYRVRP